MTSLGDALDLWDRLLDWLVKPKMPGRIARRLKRTCRLIQASSHHQITEADFAEAMNLKSAGDFEARLTGKVEADFAWIGQFAETFGVNASWIKTGIGQPFDTPLACLADPREYQSLIETLQPDEIHFVRSSGIVGEITIVFGWAEKKYLVANDMWHLSEHVGNGGARAIVEFYEFIDSMSPMFRTRLRPGGHVVSPRAFNDLIEGKIYPPTILNGRDAPWWDDLVDIDHRWPIAKDYRKKWGAGFIFAQDLIRHTLDRRKPGEASA